MELHHLSGPETTGADVSRLLKCGGFLGAKSLIGGSDCSDMLLRKHIKLH